MNAAARAPWSVAEDPTFYVIFKPAGWPCQGDPSGDESVLDRFPGHLITRLDRPVAGLVLIARSSASAAALSKQLSDGRLHKRYRARVDPALLSEDWVSVSDRLAQGRGRTEIVQEGGKMGRLRWRSAAPSGLVDVELLTGRRHQIRAQLAGHGHPIVGDRKYGGRRAEQLCLLACAYRFEHPVRGTTCSIKLPDAEHPPWAKPSTG